MDFRELKSELSLLIKDISSSDSNWKWRLNKVLKGSAHVEWGYLNYLGEKRNCFFIKYSDDAECFATYTPNDELIDIADSIEEATMQIAHYAHSRY